MRHKLPILPLLLACSCSTGPWNTQPGGNAPNLPRLLASNLVVAGRPYDTLWLTRSLLLNGATYDSTRQFVDTTHSWVRIIRTTGPGSPDTITYHLAVPLAVVWLPDRPSDSALHGAQYMLDAQITWDSTANWGAGPTSPAWKVTHLQAVTYTPKVFTQGPSLQAPIEALFPTLAGSGNSAFRTWAASKSQSVQDSLAHWSVTASTLDSVGKGVPVYRTIRTGDTIWYIRSSEAASAADGTAIRRNDRAVLAPQALDLPVFGGEIAIQRFDSTRARILDPITQAFNATTGQKSFTSKDSSRYYQPGQWRSLPFTAANPGSLAYWPEFVQIKNLDIGYTGLNVFYSYAVDTLFAAYERGQSTTTNVSAYSNIQGGFGYFTGAAVDSVSLFVLSPTTDTFSVTALHDTYCFERFTRLKDSVQKSGVTDSATLVAKSGAAWLDRRPATCAQYLPAHP